MGEIVTKSRAGSVSQFTDDEEYKFVVGTWVETLAGVVPESRLNDCYLHAARNRDNSFPMSATDMCNAWKQIKEAERSMPATGTYEWSRAREVCHDCNSTGTILFVKRHAVLGRDYTFGKPCYCQG